MSGIALKGSSLWRYNYGILVGTGYWLLVLPVAASQIVTLWMMAMGAEFSQDTATQIAELMAPILAAFLVAHSLAPEYRSGVGAVLASKPVSLHRVVTIRILFMMFAALGLTAVTLLVCSIGLKPIDVGRPLVATVPSVCFLSLVALLFATLFRNPLGGFAIAAGLWALDVSVGYGVHALLSLQGYHALLDSDPLAHLWIANKVTLLVMALVLLWVHGRVMPRISRPVERQDLAKMGAVFAGVLLLYCATGAACTISYAYLNRGRLGTTDVAWLRRQLRNYGPVPVAKLFGPAFSAYVAEPPAREGAAGDNSLRLHELQRALNTWPHSIWADSIAFAHANESDIPANGSAVPEYFTMAAKFGGSPFAPKALARIVTYEGSTVGVKDRLRAARQLVGDYPHSREAERGADLLWSLFPAQVQPDEMLRAAESAAEVAPRYRRPSWRVVIARLKYRAGDPAGGLAAAQQAVSTGQALRSEIALTGLASDLGPHVGEIDAAITNGQSLIKNPDQPLPERR